jgi:transposase
MNRESLERLGKETLIRLVLAQAETIAALTRQVEVLTARVAELEAKLGLPPKTPENSSTPPSQGQKTSGEAPEAGSNKAKRKGHKGSHRDLHPNPNRTLNVLASHCQHCAADVSAAPQHAAESYDKIEIPPIAPDVTRVVLHAGICPCCAKRFKAKAPQGFEPGSPFGPNLCAFVLYLRYAHAIPFARLARILSDLLGLAISEGALANIMMRCANPLGAALSAIRERLLSGSALQSDETSMRVGKRTWWMWTFHHGDCAAFVIAPSRGKDVIEGFLGGHRPDYWVSDRLAAQMGWAKKDHQVCLAHLIRDAQYAIDAGDDVFAPKLQELLRHACAIGRRRSDLTDATLRSYLCKLEKKLTALLAIVPPCAEGAKFKRTIMRYRQYLFVFVTVRDLPATNNGCEQNLRPCAVFRKVTNCFRSEWGARLYANIRSVLETARRKGIGALHAIRIALSAQPLLHRG